MERTLCPTLPAPYIIGLSPKLTPSANTSLAKLLVIQLAQCGIVACLDAKQQSFRLLLICVHMQRVLTM